MQTPYSQPPSAVPFRFTGDGGEYFRIWIVNVFLSVVTLGIYSAWAKVRRKRYFYGNTLLNDAGFDYLADAKAILKGRIIVFAAFVVYSLVKEFVPLLRLVMLIAFLVVLPWLVMRALSFNARNSTHRNVRFGFQAGYRETSSLLVIPVFLVALTLGLIYPYYVYRKKKYFLEHSTYGTAPFGFGATAGAYYGVYFRVAMMFLLFLAGSIVTLGIGAIPLYLLFAAYRDGAVARLTWNTTTLAGMPFRCEWRTGELFKLYFVNSLAIIVTVGLLVPWAAIRTARYQLERLTIHADSTELDGFLANAQAQVGATGDEAADLLGFDFGL